MIINNSLLKNPSISSGVNCNFLHHKANVKRRGFAFIKRQYFFVEYLISTPEKIQNFPEELDPAIDIRGK